MTSKNLWDKFFGRLFTRKDLSLDDLVVEYEKTLRYIFLMQEKDKKRIAGDLHDCISSLSRTKFCIDTLEIDKLDEKTKRSLKVSIELVDSTIECIKNLVDTIRPFYIDFSSNIFILLQSLRKHFEEFEKEEDVRIKIVSLDKEEVLVSDEALKLSIYRAVQTCIWRAIRSFKASKIFITLEGSLKIIIEDNGNETPLNKEFYKSLTLWIKELVKLRGGLIKEERTKKDTNKTTITWVIENLKDGTK